LASRALPADPVDAARLLVRSRHPALDELALFRSVRAGWPSRRVWAWSQVGGPLRGRVLGVATGQDATEEVVVFPNGGLLSLWCVPYAGGAFLGTSPAGPPPIRGRAVPGGNCVLTAVHQVARAGARLAPVSPERSDVLVRQLLSVARG
jgi:hypothetical protein